MNWKVLKSNWHYKPNSLTDIYRVFQSNTIEYTFISEVHGILSKTGHILDSQDSLNKCRKILTTSCILSDYSKD